MKPQGFFSHLIFLWKRFWTSSLRNVQAHDPQYVYDSVLQKRRDHFRQLKQSTSTLILLRNRTQARIHKNAETLKLLEASINKNVIANSDSKAVALIRKKQTVVEQNGKLQSEQARLEIQINRAKKEIEKGRVSIDALEQEREEMVARKNYVVNRIELQKIIETSEDSIQHSSPALEHIRDSLTQMEIQADLGEDPLLTISSSISAEQLREESYLEKAKQELNYRRDILSKRLLQESVSTPLSSPPGLKPIKVGS